MAFAARIKVTTTTAGTGSLTLGATGVRDATNGDCLAPAERVAELANSFMPYFITSGGNFAYGMGRLSADCLTLSRDNDEKRWNGTNFAVGKLTLAGTSTVILTPRPADFTASNIGRSIATRMGAYLA